MRSEVTLDIHTPPSAPELRNLYSQVNWARNRNVVEIQHMIEGMNVFVVARRDGKLVGFGRALSDGTFKALVDDIIVDESCRKQGVGRMIMGALMEQLSSIDEIFLHTGEHLNDFYMAFGFGKFTGYTMTVNKSQ